jgi:hypothetical protein
MMYQVLWNISSFDAKYYSKQTLIRLSHGNRLLERILKMGLLVKVIPVG